MNRKYNYKTRIQRSIQALSHNPSNMALVAKELDRMINDGTLPTDERAKEDLSHKKMNFGWSDDDQLGGFPSTPGGNGKSKLDIRTNDRNLAYAMGYNWMRQWMSASQGQAKNDFKQIPPIDHPDRDYWLTKIWKLEPILAGAVYSMCAKMTSLSWNVTGKRLQASKFAKLLAGAAFMDGYDWGGFINSTAEDFYTTNRGVFWETPRIGDSLYGKLSDVGHIDAMNCTLTGNRDYPMVYMSGISGQTLKFGVGEFLHFSSMPSPREASLGAGFCAVDRAYRAAMLLMGLHDYDDEKLNNLPPEGVAAVTGLTMEELLDAFKLWQAERRKNQSLTFPQVLWLVSSMPNANVDVKMIGFSQLPESFDRESVVEQYVNTLALAFGVDSQEFWSQMSGGGFGQAAGSSSVQHMKAKGKGFGEFITIVERKINGETSDDVFFGFDAQDTEENAALAAIAKAWIDAFLPLYNMKPAGGPNQFGGGVQPNTAGAPAFKFNPNPQKPNGEVNLPTPMIPDLADTGGNMSSQSGGGSAAGQAEQIIDKEQFMRLLVDKGVLPDWMVDDNRATVGDTEVHQRRLTAEGSIEKSYGNYDDIVKFVWEKGVLKEVRLPPITLRSGYRQEVVESEPLPPLANRLVVDTKSYEVTLEYLSNKEFELTGKIHGKPIPDAEVTRGSSINRKTIHDELERWRHDPILAPYALSVEQEQKLFGNFKPVVETGIIKSYPIVDNTIMKTIPDDDKIELALKELQNTIQQLATSSDKDNRLNVYMERLLTVLAESRQSNQPINVIMPEQKDQPANNMTIAPVINIPPPEVTVNIPAINVPTPELVVNIAPAEVTVNVPPAEVTVNVPAQEVNITKEVIIPEHTTETIQVKRGPDGKIIELVKNS